DCMFYGLVFSPHLPFLQGRVVDMLYFPLIDTYLFGRHITFFDPVFNIADSCVTIGVFWFIIYGLTHPGTTDSLEH
ncbi:MAG: signal peptidase II, partial [Bacteroidales bacterium]|nr:signal peptidase II [Bacteroidales bacterium]